jgi:hypothetical protein
VNDLGTMPGANGSSSAAAASTSSAASNARVWKFQRSTHETLDSFYDAVMGAQANGRGEETCDSDDENDQDVEVQVVEDAATQ